VEKFEIPDSLKKTRIRGRKKNRFYGTFSSTKREGKRGKRGTEGRYNFHKHPRLG